MLSQGFSQGASGGLAKRNRKKLLVRLKQLFLGDPAQDSEEPETLRRGLPKRLSKGSLRNSVRDSLIRDSARDSLKDPLRDSLRENAETL